MMLLLTLRGTPTIYYGDEIGMHDVEIPPERIQDPFEKNVPGVGAGRDPERTPMQWDAGPNADFCPADVEPWLPVADDYQQANVASELQDPRSMLCLTRALIRTRRSNPALIQGDYHPADDMSPHCFIYLRQLDRNESRHCCLVALNFSDGEQTVAVADLGVGSIALSTHLDREGPVDLAALRLRPNEGCIVDLPLA
jgi:alpha-glucosidase